MALFAMTYLRSLGGRLHLEERAQDTFEYVLIIGGISVVVIAAVATPAGGVMIDAIIDGTCTAITNLGIPTGNCTP